MNNKYIFLTDTQFTSPRWKRAFPDAEIHYSSSSRPEAVNDSLIWLLSGSDNWLEILDFYTGKGCKVIILSRLENLNELRICLSHGARGYTDALSNAETLLQIAESVSLGAMWLPSAMISVIMQNYTISQQPSFTPTTLPLSSLSEREREVTNIVLTGASNKEIARQLNITERTVKAHLSTIFQKMNVRDRIQLMLVIRGR